MRWNYLLISSWVLMQLDIYSSNYSMEVFIQCSSSLVVFRPWVSGNGTSYCSCCRMSVQISPILK